jgi:hypothetical protein
LPYPCVPRAGPEIGYGKPYPYSLTRGPAADPKNGVCAAAPPALHYSPRLTVNCTLLFSVPLGVVTVT